VQGVLQQLSALGSDVEKPISAQLKGALRIVLDRVRAGQLHKLPKACAALDGYCYLFPQGWSQADSATDLHLLGTATEFVVQQYYRSPSDWMQELRAHAVPHASCCPLDTWAAQLLHDYRTRHFTLKVWLAGRGLTDIL
jgi:hypothetical protein